MTRLLLPDRATGYALAGTGGTVGVYRGRILVPSATGRHRCAPQASPSRAMIRPRRRQARRPRPPPQAHDRGRPLFHCRRGSTRSRRSWRSSSRQSRRNLARRPGSMPRRARSPARDGPGEALQGPADDAGRGRRGSSSGARPVAARPSPTRRSRPPATAPIPRCSIGRSGWCAPPAARTFVSPTSCCSAAASPIGRNTAVADHRRQPGRVERPAVEPPKRN